MTVELDSRHPLLPKAGWGKWRFDSDLKGNKWEKSLYVTKVKMHFWFLAIVIWFVFVFFSFTPAWKGLVSAKVSLQIWSLCHNRDRIVAASRPLQIYTVSAIPIGAVLACFFFVFYLVGFFFDIRCTWCKLVQLYNKANDAYIS
jgi:hypothetical protein